MKKKQKKNFFTSCIIAAGGQGTRMGAEINKIFLDLCDIPVIAHSLLTMENNSYIDEIIIVTAECDIPGCADIVKEFKISKVKTIVKGGKTRQESVRNGLFEVSPASDIVIIHDAARPLVESENVTDVVLAADNYGAAALGVYEKNTLKLIDDDGFIQNTIDRSRVCRIHTPQAFKTDMAQEIHKYAEENGILGTDDCFLAEHMGKKIRLIEDSYENIKITTKEDLLFAEQILINR